VSFYPVESKPRLCQAFSIEPIPTIHGKRYNASPDTPSWRDNTFKSILRDHIQGFLNVLQFDHASGLHFGSCYKLDLFVFSLVHHDVVAQCGAGSKPTIGPHHNTYEVVESMHIRCWYVPLDSPLILSRTNFIWSNASAEADLDSASHDLVAQCGAGGLSKLDLISAQTTLSRWPYMR
jgi:hypothetical protein